MNCIKQYPNRMHDVDPAKGITLLCSGVFEREVYVGPRKRRMLIYVPEGTRPSCPGVFVLGENGQSADDLLQNSRWRELADNDDSREKFIVFFLEPENGIWHTEEEYGVRDGDVAYVNAAFLEGCKRDLVCVHESRFYLFGCSEGGIIANMAAMQHPVVWAGIGAAGNINVQRTYMQAAAKDDCVDLDGFEDENHSICLKKGDTAVPAVIFHDEKDQKTVNPLIQYWLHAAGITSEGTAEIPGTIEYVRSCPPPFPGNQDKDAFRVSVRMTEQAGTDFANDLLPDVKAFLFAQRRWMGDPGGI